MEVIREEASAVSLKLPNLKVPKLLITIDREGGHVLVDRELWEKVLQEKKSVEELKLLKS